LIRFQSARGSKPKLTASFVEWRRGWERREAASAASERRERAEGMAAKQAELEMEIEELKRQLVAAAKLESTKSTLAIR